MKKTLRNLAIGGTVATSITLGALAWTGGENVSTIRQRIRATA